MNYTRRTRRNQYYLDVSDFILTDPRQAVPSPRRATPLSIHPVDLQLLQQLTAQSSYFKNKLIQILTPGNVPIIIQVQGVQLSPYFATNGPALDIQFYDFTLEIPEENQQNQFSGSQESQQNNQNQNNSKMPQIIEQQIQESISQSYPEIQISRYNIQYFNEAMTQLKKMKATQNQIRQFVLQYITEENYLMEDIDSMDLKQLIGVAHQNLRPVGPISWLERKFKVNKYIQKKKKRVWKKKISYDCRKRVADNRLRVKGKFVTKKQACNMLGVQQLNDQELKLLLEAKSSKMSTQNYD